MVGVNEDNGDLLQKVSCTATLSAPNPAAGHRQPTPLLETPEHSQASLGQSPVRSLLLSPGPWCAHNFVCALQGSVSPVLHKLWRLYDGINGDLLQKDCACTDIPSAPHPAAGHHRPTPPLETPGHSQACLGQSLVGSLLLYPGSLYAHVFICALQESVSPVL